MATGLGEFIHVTPIYHPVSGNTSATSQFVDLLDFTDEWEFIVQTGLMGSSDGTGTWVLIPYLTSTTTAAGTASAFRYRLGTTTGDTDALGAVTTCANTGLALTSDDDYKVVIIKVDPPMDTAQDVRYAYLALDLSTDDNSTGVLSALFVGVPRHKQTSMRTSSA